MRKPLIFGIALFGMAGFAPAQTALLASTFENASNNGTMVGRAFTGGTAGGVWKGTAAGATFRGSFAQHRGSGALSGLISRTAPDGYGEWWGDLAGGGDLVPTAGQTLAASAAFLLPGTGANASNGSLFGLESFGAAGSFGSIYLYGGEQGGSRAVVRDASGTLFDAYDASGRTLGATKGAWSLLTIQVAYGVGNATANFFVDGERVYRSTGVSYVPLTFTETRDWGVSDFDLATGAIDGTTNALGSAYVDDYAVTLASAPVPEPTGLTALGLGLFSLRRRRFR